MQAGGPNAPYSDKNEADAVTADRYLQPTAILTPPKSFRSSCRERQQDPPPSLGDGSGSVGHKCHRIA